MDAEAFVPSGDHFLLFVYGTLMRSGVRHRLLSGQRFRGEVRTQPLYALFDLGAYPGLVHRPAEGRAIHGELYETAVSLKESLDTYEGAPDLYRLERILIDGQDGDVFAYFYQQSTERIPLCAEDRWPNER